MSDTDSTRPDPRRPRHRATIAWNCDGPGFATGRYSRAHTWTFDGGVTVPASPSPHVVPAPWSQAAAVDPEEAFVAALASCHMLTFLWLASKAGWSAVRYHDEAYGVMTKNERRISWVSLVVLRPQVEWGGATRPSDDDVRQLHAQAHSECFIANSVRTTIQVETADTD